MSEPKKEETTPQEKEKTVPPPKEKGGKQQQQQQQKKEKGGKQQQQQQQQKKEKGGKQQQQQGDQQGQQQQGAQGKKKEVVEEKKDLNAVPMFAHLQPFEEKKLSFITDQHPSVVRASLAISQMQILGSNARCIAMLTAIIDALGDFPTSEYGTDIPHAELKRRITKYISKIVGFFNEARPISHGMGNAVFEIKNFISMELPDIVTKEFIDQYLGQPTQQQQQQQQQTSQSPPPPPQQQTPQNTLDAEKKEGEIIIVKDEEQVPNVGKISENNSEQKNFDGTTSMTSPPQINKQKSSLTLSGALETATAPIDNTVVPEIKENYAMKAFVCAIIKFIRTFIYFRIYKAESILISHGETKVNNGDVIMTYGYSYSVEKILCEAHLMQQKEFKVIVIDSHPLFEGRRMLDGLSAAGIECTYALLSGLSYAMKPATKVILGASALLKNGYGLARAGTALVTTAAKACHIPVIFCCESYKFTPKVQLDSIIYNQIGDPDAIANDDSRSYNANFDAGKLPKKKSGFSTIFDEEMEDESKLVSSVSDSAIASSMTSQNGGGGKGGKGQQQQQQQPQQRQMGKKILKPTRLKMLNVMLDVTPIENIAMVICEHGCIPPTTVPVIIDEYLRYNNE